MYISPEVLVLSGLLALALLVVLALLIASAGGLAGAGVALWFLGKLTGREESRGEQTFDRSSVRRARDSDFQ
jgi:type IV secretory pathway TrbD component